MAHDPVSLVQDPQRLAALHHTTLLDSPAEAAFDRLTRLATTLLQVPIALVSLVDAHRQFFKSCVGLPEPWATQRETPLSHSFCQHVVASSVPLLIPDAREHPLVRDSLAIADLGVVAYLGVPLTTSTGDTLGSFCVIDTQPRAWTAAELAIVQELAASAVTEIELRRQTEVAYQALRAYDELLGMVSHDLKNPVSVIRGYANLMQRWLTPGRPPEVEQLRAGVHQIDRAAAALVRQIDELLDTARLQAGQGVELAGEPTDLVALARGVCESQQQTTARHQLRLETTLPSLVGAIDPARIQRVLMNLVANAITYSPAGGEIVVGVQQQEEAAAAWGVLSVRDHGLGIPAADVPHIFARFHRATNVRGRIAGTGLGLTSVRQIVEQHGGSIDVTTAEGVGSTFTVRLPLAASGGTETAAAPA